MILESLLKLRKHVGKGIRRGLAKGVQKGSKKGSGQGVVGGIKGVFSELGGITEVQMGVSDLDFEGMDYAALVNAASETAPLMPEEGLMAQARIHGVNSLLNSNFNQTRVAKASKSMFQKRV